MTPEEDAALTAAAEADPDNPPADELFRRARGGRPRAENPKQQVTLRLDPDVVERLKADGPGWQTRANAALRKAVGLK
ncbi:BrnA antitoxin family protein [Amorphus sp. 3PC139-8]